MNMHTYTQKYLLNAEQLESFFGV
uniref:Uncharacterized protein n=1 Tax=Anguilla anguilla TaxID=7936 RepID=A0A0E9W5D9_ANGAN